MYSPEAYDRILKIIAVVCAAIVLVVGLKVVLGWLLDLETLKGGMAEGITVKTNTGVALFCSAASILALHVRVLGRLRFYLAGGLAVPVILLGSLTLSQHIFGWNLGIDEILCSEPVGDIATASPNRMGPPASTCLALCGIAILLLIFKSEKLHSLASHIAVGVGLIATLPTLGYIFGASQLFAISKFTGIALQTALSLILLGIAIICSASESRMLGLLRAQNAGGFLVRRLLFPALLLPVALGYVRTVGEQAGYYDTQFGRSLLILTFTVIFTRLVWSSAQVLKDTDTQRKELLESERAARAEAENASRLKDEFLATLSHELRTPLNAILGWVQLLKRSNISATESSKGMETIEKNAKLQAQLIEDMLDLSRSIAGKLVLNIKQVDLTSVLLACAQTIKPLAEAKKIALVTDYDSHKEVFIKGDADRLVQVFSNLLTNAVKFTPENGQITIALRTHNDSAEVDVIDNGQGIEPEFLVHLFDRFRQADGSTKRRFGGLGIGLSIVRDLVALHGGQVTAHSDGHDTGSIFRVTLPLDSAILSKNESTIEHALAVADPAPMSTVELKGAKILVVDDDSDARDLVKRILEDCKAEVLHASSAFEALDLLKEEKLNLLISDIGMPEQDGYEFIKNVRSLNGGKNRDIPAIALTAFIRPSDKEKAINSGFHYHIAKPLDTAELLSAVVECMRGV